jgi:iron-sulfur cluster repair protein YtfE (RIC family)
MIVELKPDQQAVLERAARAGMSADELLDQAFAVIREQYRNEEWMLAERESLASHIAEGFAQAERGELIEAEEARRLLAQRRARRTTA